MVLLTLIAIYFVLLIVLIVRDPAHLGPEHRFASSRTTTRKDS